MVEYVRNMQKVEKRDHESQMKLMNNRSEELACEIKFEVEEENKEAPHRHIIIPVSIVSIRQQ